MLDFDVLDTYNVELPQPAEAKNHPTVGRNARRMVPPVPACPSRPSNQWTRSSLDFPIQIFLPLFLSLESAEMISKTD